MQRDNSEKKSGENTKKRKKMALGRGLDALIPMQASEGAQAQSYFPCDVDRIRPNPYQPRRNFSDAELENLSDSIRNQGIIQPLLVRETGGGYELVAGERRLRAARMAGLQRVPVIIKNVSDAEMLEMSLVENIQREALNPIEEADAYHRLMHEFGLTQEQAAARVGKSRSAVANFLRLRHLPPEIKQSIVTGDLSMGHARALLGIDSKALQLDVWNKVAGRKLSVRETEKLVKQAQQVRKKPPAAAPSSEEVYLSDVSAELSRRYGTKVQIRRRGKVGRVEIEFYSNADLDRLLGLLQSLHP